MEKPYGLAADLHLHNWQAFSTVLPDGLNSRLAALHAELLRLAQEVKAAGGNRIVLAGDVFHVRGSIAPSVLNPTLDVFRKILSMGIEIIIEPGNHDLEGKHTTRLGSAVTALEGIGCKIANATHAFDNVMLVPWHDKIADLKKELEAIIADGDCSKYDLILHAPIDGTLSGIPAHGLTPEYLAGLGFKRVFAGHYHHHKHLYSACGKNDVYSIGALSHHSWSDVGSKAGFLIVHPDKVDWRKAHTPEFVDLSAATDETEAEIMAEGNFVRARIGTSDMKSVEAMKAWLTKAGAKGVIVQTVKEPAKTREGGVVHSVSAGASIEVSIAEFIKGQSFKNPEALQIECQKILAEVASEE